MKIGILTIHNSPNYGACLQCFALWKYLTDSGHDTEIVDLHRPLAYKDYKPSKRFVRSRKPTSPVKYFFKQLFNKLTGNTSLYNKEAYEKFQIFNSKIKLSKPYTGIDELYDNPPQYDLYVSGSDQLWNPTQPYCIEPYFLTFVDGSKVKKISYASSIGLPKLRPNEENRFKDWLKDFSSISVREKQTRDYLASFVNKDICHVADPTFLLDVDSWKQMVEPPKENDYIMLFTLVHKPQLVKYALEIAQEAGKELIVVGQKEPQSSSNTYKVVNTAGPSQWLGYIANASMVITDSFHCTVFSIILGVENFFSYISPSNKRGGRIIDLLNTFGASDHLLPESLNWHYEDLYKRHLDRDKINLTYLSEQERSRNFLLNNLESAYSK